MQGLIDAISQDQSINRLNINRLFRLIRLILHNFAEF